MSKETYTAKEVTELLIEERQRAVDISDAFQKKYGESGKSKRSIGDDSMAFMEEQREEVCRKIGNTIHGGTAISDTLGITMEDIVKKNLDEYNPKHPKYVSMGGTVLVLMYRETDTSKIKYFRNAGDWYVEVSMKNGKLYSVSSHKNLDNIELKPVTRKEWAESNKNYVRS